MTSKDDARSGYHVGRWTAVVLSILTAIQFAGCGRDVQDTGDTSKEDSQSKSVPTKTTLPDCPAVTPEFLSDGGLQAHAVAPDADEFDEYHYFAVFATTGEGMHGTERTAWYSPFDSGLAVIAITPRVMDLVRRNEGGIVTLSVRSDTAPPEASLQPKGDVGSAGIEDLTIKAAREKGINGSNMKERSKDLPVSQVCSNADWDAVRNMWMVHTKNGATLSRDPFNL